MEVVPALWTLCCWVLTGYMEVVPALSTLCCWVLTGYMEVVPALWTLCCWVLTGYMEVVPALSNTVLLGADGGTWRWSLPSPKNTVLLDTGDVHAVPTVSGTLLLDTLSLQEMPMTHRRQRTWKEFSLLSRVERRVLDSLPQRN